LNEEEIILDDCIVRSQTKQSGFISPQSNTQLIAVGGAV